MTRLDMRWERGAVVREETWSWRHDITGQVVNPDIDGLMTACLLHHLKGWPVIGLYDTQRLMLAPDAPRPLDMPSTIWVDVDMCWPGARSLSQHVVLDSPADLHAVPAYAETVNPSLLRGHARRSGYRTKYPFGTFQWAWWLAGTSLPDAPDPKDLVLTGLAWMPDGGFQSVEGVWRSNCLQWAVDQLPSSIMSPLARLDPDAARAAVGVAEHELQRISGVRDGWRNHQFSLTRGSSSGPVLNLPVDEAAPVLQALCDAICTVYGWRRLVLPLTYDTFVGQWRTADRPPRDWPDAAARHDVVSLAVTSQRQLCWTEPADLREVLPATSGADCTIERGGPAHA